MAGDLGHDAITDEAILDAFLEAVPDCHVLVAAPTPIAAARGCEPISLSEPAALARSLRRADAFVVAGGMVFDSAPLGRFPAVAALAGEAHMMAKPVALVGVGAGALPARRHRWLTRALVRSADLLVMGDDESARAVAAAGGALPLRIGADPGWAASAVGPEPPSRDDRVLVVLESNPAADHGDTLARALEPLVNSGLRVCLQPWSRDTDADTVMAQTVAQRLRAPVEIATPPASLPDARRRIAEAAVVVSMRYRALQLAAAGGIPAIAVVHQVRLAGLARRLGRPAVALGAPPRAWTSAILEARGTDPTSPAVIKEEAARAEAQFQLLRLVLSGGDDDVVVDSERLPLGPEPWPR